jgi:hypothetical protein
MKKYKFLTLGALVHLMLFLSFYFASCQSNSRSTVKEPETTLLFEVDSTDIYRVFPVVIQSTTKEDSVLYLFDKSKGIVHIYDKHFKNIGKDSLELEIFKVIDGICQFGDGFLVMTDEGELFVVDNSLKKIKKSYKLDSTDKYMYLSFSNLSVVDSTVFLYRFGDENLSEKSGLDQYWDSEVVKEFSLKGNGKIIDNSFFAIRFPQFYKERFYKDFNPIFCRNKNELVFGFGYSDTIRKVNLQDKTIEVNTLPQDLWFVPKPIETNKSRNKTALMEYELTQPKNLFFLTHNDKFFIIQQIKQEEYINDIGEMLDFIETKKTISEVFVSDYLSNRKYVLPINCHPLKIISFRGRLLIPIANFEKEKISYYEADI